jgi:integrase
MRRITMLLQNENTQKISEQYVWEVEREERKPPQENVTGNNILVKNVAEKMYFPESDHMKRRVRSGKPLDAHSMKEGRTAMRTIIILWGDKPVASLKAEEIVQYLSGLDRSGSYKSNFISRVKEIYREARWYGGDIPTPSFPVFKRNTRKTDTFTDWELERYFNPDMYEDSDMYLFYLCCLTAGLRSGEARGLCPKQILFDRKALMVDGFVKKNGVRTAYNKKKPGEYLKPRIVPLPGLTLRLLKEHIERKHLKDNDFCFTSKKDPSRPIAERYIYGYMARIMKKADIQTWDRKLTINSFRYTYAASIRRELPAGTVMKLVGRKYIGMMELYKKRNSDETLAELTGVETAVQKLPLKEGIPGRNGDGRK